MNANTFMKNFGHLADAPGGIRKLREMILQLAVQGKLVEQDSNDEPASELLKRILAAKSAKNSNKRRRSVKQEEDGLSPIDRPLPASWTSTTLANLVTVLNGRAYKKHELLDEGTPVLRVGNLFTSNSWYYSDLELDADKYCETGDLIYAWSASFGPFIWSGPRAIFHYHIWKLDFHSHKDLNKKYLYWFLKQRTDAIKSAGHGVSMIHMTKGKMESLHVPLPPLAEQQRIVAKVDELMALCDELESRHQQRRSVHVQLNEAALDRLTTAADPADFSTAWSRVRNQFDLLYSVPETVNQLRQAILQLAVQGKLVEQDPQDKPFLEIGDNNSVEIRMSEIPASWSIVRLKEISERVSVGHVGPTSQHYCEEAEGVTFIRSQNVRPRRLDLSGVRFITNEFHCKLKKSQLRAGDLLFVRVGANRGDCCRLPDGLPEINCANVIFARPMLEVAEYVEFYCQSRMAHELLLNMTTGSAQGVINTKSVAELPIPLPPLAEQKRVMETSDRLLALCDELEAKLTQQQTDADRLTEAMVAAILDGAASGKAPIESDVRTVVSAKPSVVSSQTDFGTVQGAISSYAINRLHGGKSFGRTQHAKVLSLVQSHVGLDLGIDFQRQPAGPFHRCIYDLERTAKKNKWYRTKKRESGSQTAYEYDPGANIDEQVHIAANLLGENQPEMDRLLTLFARMKTRRAELIATAFFVWNDYLLAGKSPTDAEITEDFFNWHESKREKFKPAKVTEAIVWLRENELVPTGKGRRTVVVE